MGKISPVVACSLLGWMVAFLVINQILRAHARKSLLQTALERREFHQTHQGVVPRLGGMAFAAAFVAVALFSFLLFPTQGMDWPNRFLIMGSALAMFGLGLRDDLYPLGAKKKLLAQVLIAAVAFYGGIRIESFKNPLSGEIYDLGLASGILTVGWLVTLTNLMNLIDGLDGLAGGIGLMLMGLLTYLSHGSPAIFPTLCATGVSAALIGFLFYNFPPARIYMGDGGAYFLGFLIGVLSIVNSQKGSVIAALLAPLLALGLPILDTSLAIARRGLRGLPLFRPDRKHIHHRLMASGISRTRVLLTLYALSLAFLAVAFGYLLWEGRALPIVFGLACVLMLFTSHKFKLFQREREVVEVWQSARELRKGTRYAFQLNRLLEAEAEHCGTLDELWERFTAQARKLGFCRMQLTSASGQWNYAADEPGEGAPADRQIKFDLDGVNFRGLEFHASSHLMRETVFRHLAELAAEGWVNASTQWHRRQARPRTTPGGAWPANAASTGEPIRLEQKPSAP